MTPASVPFAVSADDPDEALTRAFADLCKRHNLLGAVLLTFEDHDDEDEPMIHMRAGANGDVMSQAMRDLGDMILEKIENGELNPPQKLDS